jgi:hypothetical protein
MLQQTQIAESRIIFFDVVETLFPLVPLQGKLAELNLRAGAGRVFLSWQHSSGLAGGLNMSTRHRAILRRQIRIDFFYAASLRLCERSKYHRSRHAALYSK